MSGLALQAEPVREWRASPQIDGKREMAVYGLARLKPRSQRAASRENSANLSKSQQLTPRFKPEKSFSLVLPPTTIDWAELGNSIVPNTRSRGKHNQPGGRPAFAVHHRAEMCINSQ